MSKRPLLILWMIVILISFTYAEELRDPFASVGDKMTFTQKPQGEVKLPYPVTLRGTLCAKNAFVAIVNNAIIKEGQMWQDFYVAKIEPGKVILEWHSKKFEIALSPEEELKEGKQKKERPERKQ